MKKYLKNTGGITLISLLITIIILLILAGISIQALTNQGIFGRANDAKKESEIANIKEQIALDIYEKQLEPPLGSITDEQLETILGKYGTVNKEDGTIVGITTAKGYEILLKDIYGGETVAESVPDGATVTPVNDITTWLKTGEISKQYSYTTIEQVIADSTCTESLMNNENAMKYLARSTEFADAICASETTMTSLGKSAYVDDTVLNSDLWVDGICNSEYFELVLSDKVPTMTSNTEPSGIVECGSDQTTLTINSDKWEHQMFDGDTSTFGPTKGYNSSYLGWTSYTFVNPIKVKKISVVNGFHNGTYRCKTFKIQALNISGNWIDLTENLILTNDSTEHYYTLTKNTDYYSSYRIYIIDSYEGENGSTGVNKLQLYGRYYE